jgi:hypothetical protein
MQQQRQQRPNPLVVVAAGKQWVRALASCNLGLAQLGPSAVLHNSCMLPAVSCAPFTAAATVEMLEAATSAAPAPLQFLNRLKPPRWLFRTVACLILGGQVVGRISRGT